MNAGDDGSGAENTIDIRLKNNAGSDIVSAEGNATAGARIQLPSTNGSEAHVLFDGYVYADAASYVVFSNTELYPGTNFASMNGQIPQSEAGFDYTWLLVSIAIPATLLIVHGRKRASITQS